MEEGWGRPAGAVRQNRVKSTPDNRRLWNESDFETGVQHDLGALDADGDVTDVA
jgi:hypothetical protein